MKKELQEKLIKDFPLLYEDTNKPLTQSLMAFGFEFGNGWYNLVYELSAKLEKLIEQFIKENPNPSCRYCGCDKNKHYAYLSKTPGKCLAVIKHQTKWVYNKRTYKPYLLNKIICKVRSVFNKVLGLFCYELRTCHCEKYEASYPRAAQAKEKYGSLRLYMTTGTDEMYDLIVEAEGKSRKTCEECGDEGHYINDGWVFTLCESCNEKRKNRRRW